VTASVALPLVDLFAPATETVNAWRGRCLASFARAEAAISVALVTLGGPVPLLVGQRQAALATRLRGRSDALDACAALDAFGVHDPLRRFLCHGDSRVTLDRRGRWQASFTLLVPERDGVGRRFLLIDEAEATALASALARDRQRLVCALERLGPFSSGCATPPLRTG